MCLAKKYLNMSENKVNEELPLKLQTALDRLDKKPVQKKSEMAVKLLNDLVQVLSSTSVGIRTLKEFAPTAYETVVRGDTEEPESTEV